MKRVLATASTIAVIAATAHAGGIDRGQTPTSVLFEDGNYIQFGISTSDPNVTGSHGSGVAAAGVSTSTGNMAGSESQASFALKLDLTEQLSFGFFLTNPYGANADYTEGLYSTLTGAQLAGLNPGLAGLSGNANLSARWRSTGYEGLLKYQINERASVYGGVRAVVSTAEISIPIQLVAVASSGSLVGDYFADGSNELDFGYVLGAAYEIPDIAARVAITYRSEIVHDFTVQERASRNVLGTLSSTGFGSDETSVEVRMPQSVTIDFQTGIAEDTLLFGSAKWTEWSVWGVETEQYEAATGGEITGFDNDVWTYSLGVGRRINDNLSVFASIGYEESKGGEPSRLAPTDGFRSIALGGEYTFDGGTSVRAGLQRTWVGASEIDDGAFGTTEFESNTVTSFGMSVGVSF